MSVHDRDRWNAKYAAGFHGDSSAGLELDPVADWLPTHGRALDVAGGAGRHAIWLASRGLQVTLVDISDVALEIARQRAAAAGVDIETVQADLEHGPLPAGPWNLVLCVHYLERRLFDDFAANLAPGGLLLIRHPTVSNLQRHDKPPRPYLLEDGELPGLIRDLTIVHYQEGWSKDDRHVALLVARK